MADLAIETVSLQTLPIYDTGTMSWLVIYPSVLLCYQHSMVGAFLLALQGDHHNWLNPRSCLLPNVGSYLVGMHRAKDPSFFVRIRAQLDHVPHKVTDAVVAVSAWEETY